MSKEKAQLYQKILAVMKDVSYLQKDDNVSTGQGRPTYKAISEEKVTMAVRSAMVTHGLVILPVEQEHIKEDIIKQNEHKGFLSTVNVKYKIVDVETGESEIITSSGTGVDTQDKGVGKAMTYSYKYLLLRTFAIPTGDDPDKVSSAEWDEKFKSQPSQSSNNQPSTVNGKPASEAQLNKIDILLGKVASKTGITKQAAYDTMKKKMNTATDIESFTMTQASQAIKILETATAGAA